MGDYIPDFDEAVLADLQPRADVLGTMLSLRSAFAAMVCLVAAKASECFALTPVTDPQNSSQADVVNRDTPTDDSWHKYVRAPPSETVIPKGIVPGSATGVISNPGGLVDGKGVAVLTRLRSSDPVPSVIVDFGQNVVGYLNLRLKGSSTSSSALPGLRLAFSETLQYLTDRSDFTRSDNADSADVRAPLSISTS
jgi:hypothetical protein